MIGQSDQSALLIPSEARNLSSARTQEKRDSSLRRLRSE